MQPHVNLGIRFRTHFQWTEPSREQLVKDLRRDITAFREDMASGDASADTATIKGWIRHIRGLIRSLR